jgi:hypothetical protein
MVPPVEEQMHKALIRQEEERCKKLEVEYEHSDETRGKEVKRKQIAKPWTRPGAKALCQRADLLILVTEYNYDLTDGGFQKYCEARGTVHVAGEFGSRRWEFFSDHGKLKSEYLGDTYFQFAETVDGKRYQYTDREMEMGWEIILQGRATLQDCWELYIGERKGK